MNKAEVALRKALTAARTGGKHIERYDENGYSFQVGATYFGRDHDQRSIYRRLVGVVFRVDKTKALANNKPADPKSLDIVLGEQSRSIEPILIENHWTVQFSKDPGDKQRRCLYATLGPGIYKGETQDEVA